MRYATRLFQRTTTHFRIRQVYRQILDDLFLLQIHSGFGQVLERVGHHSFISIVNLAGEPQDLHLRQPACPTVTCPRFIPLWRETALTSYPCSSIESYPTS